MSAMQTLWFRSRILRVGACAAIVAGMLAALLPTLPASAEGGFIIAKRQNQDGETVSTTRAPLVRDPEAYAPGGRFSSRSAPDEFGVSDWKPGTNWRVSTPLTRQQVVDIITHEDGGYSALTICERLDRSGISPSQVELQDEKWTYIGDQSPTDPDNLMSVLWNVPRCSG